MPLHTAIVCDLQYLSAILALKLTCLRSLSFFWMNYNCPHARLWCWHTHSCWVSFLHLKSDQFRYTIPSFVPHHQSFRVLAAVSFFIPPSVGSFSSIGKSFSILQYLASLGFSNPLSTHVMLFVHFSAPQYLAIIFLILSIARNPSLSLSPRLSLSSDRTLSVVFLKLGSPSAFSSVLPP